MSPRTPQQFREMREEKMALIMDVALEHFAGEGYFRTTIDHIARHAGISKGLLYNYFESKEALLKAIVHRSVNEIFSSFDQNRDGYLSEDEFEYFIRQISTVMKDKRSFWRLLMQLLMQNDAREQLLKMFPVSDNMTHPGHQPGDSLYPGKMFDMVKDYFIRKKKRIGNKYDPDNEMKMFIVTMKGFAMTTIYSDEEGDSDNEKILNRLIELYK
jgi:AcrR family transcriptional regulator